MDEKEKNESDGKTNGRKAMQNIWKVNIAQRREVSWNSSSKLQMRHYENKIWNLELGIPQKARMERESKI
jgi:hypothetical protein